MPYRLNFVPWLAEQKNKLEKMIAYAPIKVN